MLALWHAHRDKFAVFLLILVLVALLSSGGGAGQSGTLSGQAGGWSTWSGHWLFSRIAEGWEATVGDPLAIQNDLLRTENALLREEKTRLIGVLQENSRLRSLVDLQERFDAYHMVTATVVGRDSTPYFRVVKIKLRTDEPVEVGNAVLAIEGLVGSVWSVNPPFADVLMVPDPRSQVDVIAQRNRAHGVIQGMGLGRNHHARVVYLRREDEVRQGDLFVTSGLGEMFPAEVPVGRVASVVFADAGVFQEVVVEPVVDFTRLREVFVLRSGGR
jgi:rod shape-determining protein MreC